MGFQISNSTKSGEKDICTPASFFLAISNSNSSLRPGPSPPRKLAASSGCPSPRPQCLASPKAQELEALALDVPAQALGFQELLAQELLALAEYICT